MSGAVKTVKRAAGRIVGTVIGATIGFALGGPVGALQGASIGYTIGAGVDNARNAPDPEYPSVPDTGQLATGIGENAWVPKAYGQRRGGMVITATDVMNTNGDGYRIVGNNESGSYAATVYTIGEGPIESIQNIYYRNNPLFKEGQTINFNTVYSFANDIWSTDQNFTNLSVEFKRGEFDQTRSTLLSSITNADGSDWFTQQDVGHGIAYMVLLIRRDTNSIIRETAPSLTIDIKGKRVREIRLVGSPRQYSGNGYVSGTNPALIALDQLRDPNFGVGIPDEDIDFDAFVNFANYCDSPGVYSDNTVINPFTINGQFRQGATTKQILEEIALATGALFTDENGIITVKIDRQEILDTTQSINADNIVGSVTRTEAKTSEAPNVINIKYLNELGIEVIDVVAFNDDVISREGRKEADLDLRMVQNSSHAREMGKRALYDVRSSAIAFKMTDVGFNLDVYGVATMSDILDTNIVGSNTRVRINSVIRQRVSTNNTTAPVEVSCRIYNEQKYIINPNNNNIGINVIPSANKISEAGGVANIPAPSQVTITTISDTNASISFLDTLPYSTQIQFRKIGTIAWIDYTTAITSPVDIQFLEAGTYEISLRYISANNLGPGPRTIVTYTTTGITVPDTPDNGIIFQGDDYISSQNRYTNIQFADNGDGYGIRPTTAAATEIQQGNHSGNSSTPPVVNIEANSGRNEILTVNLPFDFNAGTPTPEEHTFNIWENSRSSLVRQEEIQSAGKLKVFIPEGFQTPINTNYVTADNPSGNIFRWSDIWIPYRTDLGNNITYELQYATDYGYLEEYNRDNRDDHTFYTLARVTIGSNTITVYEFMHELVRQANENAEGADFIDDNGIIIYHDWAFATNYITFEGGVVLPSIWDRVVFQYNSENYSGVRFVIREIIDENGTTAFTNPNATYRGNSGFTGSGAGGGGGGSSGGSGSRALPSSASGTITPGANDTLPAIPNEPAPVPFCNIDNYIAFRDNLLSPEDKLRYISECLPNDEDFIPENQAVLTPSPPVPPNGPAQIPATDPKNKEASNAVCEPDENGCIEINVRTTPDPDAFPTDADGNPLIDNASIAEVVDTGYEVELLFTNANNNPQITSISGDFDVSDNAPARWEQLNQMLQDGDNDWYLCDANGNVIQNSKINSITGPRLPSEDNVADGTGFIYSALPATINTPEDWFLLDGAGEVLRSPGHEVPRFPDDQLAYFGDNSLYILNDGSIASFSRFDYLLVGRGWALTRSSSLNYADYRAAGRPRIPFTFYKTGNYNDSNNPILNLASTQFVQSTTYRICRGTRGFKSVLPNPNFSRVITTIKLCLLPEVRDVNGNVIREAETHEEFCNRLLQRIVDDLNAASAEDGFDNGGNPVFDYRLWSIQDKLDYINYYRGNTNTTTPGAVGSGVPDQNQIVSSILINNTLDNFVFENLSGSFSISVSTINSSNSLRPTFYSVRLRNQTTRHATNFIVERGAGSTGLYKGSEPNLGLVYKTVESKMVIPFGSNAQQIAQTISQFCSTISRHVRTFAAEDVVNGISGWSAYIDTNLPSLPVDIVDYTNTYSQGENVTNPVSGFRVNAEPLLTPEKFDGDETTYTITGPNGIETSFVSSTRVVDKTLVNYGNNLYDIYPPNQITGISTGEPEFEQFYQIPADQPQTSYIENDIVNNFGYRILESNYEDQESLYQVLEGTSVSANENAGILNPGQININAITDYDQILQRLQEAFNDIPDWHVEINRNANEYYNDITENGLILNNIATEIKIVATTKDDGTFISDSEGETFNINVQFGSQNGGNANFRVDQIEPQTVVRQGSNRQVILRPLGYSYATTRSAGIVSDNIKYIKRFNWNHDTGLFINNDSLSVYRHSLTEEANRSQAITDIDNFLTANNISYTKSIQSFATDGLQEVRLNIPNVFTTTFVQILGDSIPGIVTRSNFYYRTLTIEGASGNVYMGYIEDNMYILWNRANFTQGGWVLAPAVEGTNLPWYYLTFIANPLVDVGSGYALNQRLYIHRVPSNVRASNIATNVDLITTDRLASVPVHSDSASQNIIYETNLQDNINIVPIFNNRNNSSGGFAKVVVNHGAIGTITNGGSLASGPEQVRIRLYEPTLDGPSQLFNKAYWNINPAPPSYTNVTFSDILDDITNAVNKTEDTGFIGNKISNTEYTLTTRTQRAVDGYFTWDATVFKYGNTDSTSPNTITLTSPFTINQHGGPIPTYFGLRSQNTETFDGTDVKSNYIWFPIKNENGDPLNVSYRVLTRRVPQLDFLSDPILGNYAELPSNNTIDGDELTNSNISNIEVVALRTTGILTGSIQIYQASKSRFVLGRPVDEEDEIPTDAVAASGNVIYVNLPIDITDTAGRTIVNLTNSSNTTSFEAYRFYLYESGTWTEVQ